MRRLKLFALVLALSMNVYADPWFTHDHPRDFHRYDQHVWRSGAWYQGEYGGRFGWYWVVGGTYYYYPRPVYPFPDPFIPSVVVVRPPASIQQQKTQLEAQPQAPVWYFCESANAFYPYVSECNGEWKTVPASPSPPTGK